MRRQRDPRTYLLLAALSSVLAGPAAASTSPQVREVDDESTEGVVDLQVPAEVVVRVLGDFERWPTLFTDVTSLHRLNDANAKGPDTFKINLKVIGHDHTYRLTTGQNTVRAEMLDGEAGLKVIAEYRIEGGPAPESSRLRLRVRAAFSGPVGWFTPDRVLRKRRVQKVQADLGDLLKRTKW